MKEEIKHKKCPLGFEKCKQESCPCGYKDGVCNYNPADDDYNFTIFVGTRRSLATMKAAEKTF